MKLLYDFGLALSRNENRLKLRFIPLIPVNCFVLILISHFNAWHCDNSQFQIIIGIINSNKPSKTNDVHLKKKTFIDL